MRHLLHRLSILVAVVLIGLPITFAATMALTPLWSMIERRYGLESVGHSGPADWCFWLVFAVYLFLAAIVALRMRSAAPGSASTGSTPDTPPP